MNFTESIVEDAALAWLVALGYAATAAAREGRTAPSDEARRS